MDGTSLLSFMDSPFLVGDPEGRVVYVNPAFERRFCSNGEEVLGEALATLFAGGGRESILNAVASVCATGQTARFRMREEARGYLGIASPIEAPIGPGEDRVGVVVLLCDEPDPSPRVLAVQREIQEPLDEAMTCLEQLIDQTGGRRSEQFRALVELGLDAVARAQKWSVELTHALQGRVGKASVAVTFDASRLVRKVVGRVAPHFERAGVTLDLLAPAELPRAHGDEDMLSTALVRLLRLRMATAIPGTALTLAARTAGESRNRFMLITIVDHPRRRAQEGDSEGGEPQSLCEAVEPHAGRVRTVVVPKAGRATAICLPLA